jgi:hypothetical protein
MAVSTVSLAAREKERRQRMIAIVGGVIFLILLFIQVPRLLKRLNAKAPTSSSAPAQTTPATTPAPGTTPASSGGSTKLTEIDLAPTPAAGQLVTFSRFKSKDPFVQQIIDRTAASTTSTSTPATTSTPAASTSTPATQPAAVPATPAATPAPVQTPTTSSSSGARALSSASAPISVNGVAQTVQVGSLFPKRERIFRLVSVTATTATISIAGGSLEGGATTATLTLGRTLTLMNKANGRRYALRLLSIS